MNEYFYILLTSLGSIVALFILTRLMGCRQMSQLSMFDYINGITIGSIAAEMATALENNFMYPLFAMIIYALAAIFLSRLSEVSIWVRRIFVGKPIIVYNHGKLYKGSLKKCRLELNEFLTQCRIAGYFDLSQLESIVMEPNGHLSFLPLSDERPATPKDLNLSPAAESMAATVIVDGHIMYENLKHTGNDEKWLTQQLKGFGVTNVGQVFLATCDSANSLNVYAKLDEKPVDIFV